MLGMLQAVTSPTNTGGVFQRQIDQGNGKRRQVEVFYGNRPCRDTTSTSTSRNCNGGDADGATCTTYDITRRRSRPFKFELDVMRFMCKTNEMWIAEKIQEYMDQVETDVNTDLITVGNTLVGDFLAGPGAPKDVTFRNKPTTAGQIGDWIPEADMEIMEDFLETEAMMFGKPILVGSGLVHKYYAYYMKQACCNDAGQDQSSVGGNVNLYYDRFVPSILGSEQFFAFAPGALQFVTFNDFRGDWNQFNQPTEQQGLLINPKSGVQFDYWWKLDCGVIKGECALRFDLFGVPLDVFNTCDDLDNVTWVFKYKGKELS